MFCNLCHTDIGNHIGLCDPCSVKREAARKIELQELKTRFRERQKQILRDSQGRGEQFPMNVLACPRKLFAFSILSLAVIFPITLFSLLPKPHLGAALILSLALVVLVISICACVEMWLELMLENPYICLLSFVLPISIYSLVMSNPERAKKPFTIHIVSLVLGLFLISGVGMVSDMSGWRVLLNAVVGEKAKSPDGSNPAEPGSVDLTHS